MNSSRQQQASICDTVKETKGQKTDIQLQGDIDAKLKGLLSRFAELGGSAKGSLSHEEFEGLSREATATALEGDRSCRERVFNKMFDKLSFAEPGSRTFQGGAGIPFEDTEVRGVLKPGNEPTPSNGCDGGLIGADALKVLIGDNAITHDGYGAFTAIGIGACDAISMERRNDGIFVNASLFDRERQAVVSIRDNQITALNGENYSARQSRDESRLTVKNARGTELFYVRYLNPTTIQFRGFLGCAGGPVLRVQDGQPIPGFFMTHSCLANAQRGIQIGPR